MAVAVVCVVLLAILAVVQVAHTHQGVSDADHCPLCIVMHTAAPVVAAALLVALVQVATAAPVLKVSRVTRHWHPQLFTRPPPTSC
jgi:AhpD family alkylhydroperoxidase